MQPPSLELYERVPTKYSSVWIYFHKSNHDGGKHRRLRSFDAFCWQGGTWLKVLDQHASSDMFTQLDEQTATATDSPCHSCWKRVVFDQPCTSEKWKLGNFNGLNPTHFGGHIHMQEVHPFFRLLLIPDNLLGGLHFRISVY